MTGFQLGPILSEVSQRGKGAHLSFHVITGGSLGASFGQASQQSIERVFLHNATLPILIAQHVHKVVADQHETTADIFFYSSAVTQTFSSSPFYVASKAALESFFKSYLRLIPPNLSAFLLRLGHVDISHKYFHRLAEEDPEKFQKYLADAVPSNHFTSPDEIGSFCIHLTREKGMFNGMVCDLTGGHSWN
jgi:NAD(P)-dependent dehydrogenase (short-subunit alcohol dehydrogenase family)